MKIASDWVWPRAGRCVRGSLEFDGDRIARVALSPRTAPESRAWESLAIPGLVNAHAHLDLTWEPSTARLECNFGEWLLSVRDERLRRGATGLAALAADGVRRALAAGTSVIIDYDAAGASTAALAASPLRRVLLREVIAFDDAAERLLPELESFLDGAGAGAHERRGLAPHAPFTVHPELLTKIVAVAKRRRVPWSMHVAEQPFEAEFLRRGSGELAKFFAAIGRDVRDFPLPRKTAVEALRERALLESRPLLVHGNYLEAEEIDAIALAGATLVFCPRSHRWFGHAPHPLPRLLAAGVNVALGTDGLLSNGELSILEEMREVRRAFPSLAAKQIAYMGTGAGHRALAGALGSGTLVAGAPADVAVFRVCRRTSDILEDLLVSEARLEALYIAGSECSRAHP